MMRVDRTRGKPRITSARDADGNYPRKVVAVQVKARTPSGYTVPGYEWWIVHRDGWDTPIAKSTGQFNTAEEALAQAAEVMAGTDVDGFDRPD